MKLITLNTWGGRAGITELVDFFHTHADTDIFCLQEMWNGGEEARGQKAGNVMLHNVYPELLSNIARVLPDHKVIFRPHLRDFYGLAMFVRSSIPIEAEGEVWVHKSKGYEEPEDLGKHARNMQYVTIRTEHGLRTVINFHGLWNGMGKTDTDDRLTQSTNICSFIHNLSHPFVLAGDFNLLPDTKSLCMLEDVPMRNLIKEYSITSTRTSLYTKPEKFADYVLVSNDITVDNFSVLPDEVSDHAPLLLSFS